MKTKIILLLALLSFIISCATVPITGRKQLSLIPSAEINAMSFTSYSEFLSQNEVVTSGKDAELIKNVGANIQKAVEDYFTMQNMSGHLNGYEWEFNLVKDEAINAWCMPGGKVVFYTGILPVCENELGIAVVMGHEVAHAVAGHGNERMSQGLMLQLGGMALQKALDQKPEETKQLFMTAFGVGAQVGLLLPYSRLHESEADELGLIFMAMAGYDPNHAVNFWQRMASLSSGAPPEFLSTHPSDDTRIKKIQKALPKALQYYKQN